MNRGVNVITLVSLYCANENVSTRAICHEDFMLTSPKPSVTFKPMWISSSPEADGSTTSVSIPIVSKLSGFKARKRQQVIYTHGDRRLTCDQAESMMRSKTRLRRSSVGKENMNGSEPLRL